MIIAVAGCVLVVGLIAGFTWGWLAGQNLMAGQVILALTDVEPERSKRQAILQRLLHIRGAQVAKRGSHVKDLEQ